MFEYLREIIGLLMLALVPLFGFMAWGAVRRERRRQESELVTPPLEAPELPVEIYVKEPEVFYVATTLANEPLRRLWAFGLGSRGRASVKLLGTGLAIYRHGEKSLFVPFQSILETSVARATIDRGTETNGLLAVIWRHNNVILQTTLRFTSTQEHNSMLYQLKERVDAHSN